MNHSFVESLQQNTVWERVKPLHSFEEDTMGKSNRGEMRWCVDGQSLSLICAPWCLTEIQSEQKPPLQRSPSALVLDSNLGSLAMA